MQRRMMGRHSYHDRHFSVQSNCADVTVGVVTAAAVASSLFP